MIQDEQQRLKRRSGKSRVLTGLFLVGAGAALLIQKMYHPFADWVFTWPVILIAIGVFSGLRRGFRGGKWLIMIALGAFFLAGEIYPHWNIREYAGPALIIGVGLIFILRPRHHGRWDHYEMRERFRGKFDRFTDIGEEKKKDYTRATYSNNSSNEDMLDVVSIFGGTKKIITSQDFKGGEITSFLGGTELNLTQAEIQGRVELDITNVLGGTKLIVPSHWEIKPELVSVFGSIEDKRQLTGAVDATKILVLKGSSVFGGIEIRSF